MYRTYNVQCYEHFKISSNMYESKVIIIHQSQSLHIISSRYKRIIVETKTIQQDLSYYFLTIAIVTYFSSQSWDK